MTADQWKSCEAISDYGNIAFMEYHLSIQLMVGHFSCSGSARPLRLFNVYTLRPTALPAERGKDSSIFYVLLKMKDARRGEGLNGLDWNDENATTSFKKRGAGPKHAHGQLLSKQNTDENNPGVFHLTNFFKFSTVVT